MVAYATPCNDKPECIDGSDEWGCKFPTWLLISLLPITTILLCVTLFIYLYIAVNKTFKTIGKEASNPKLVSSKAKKLIETASLIAFGTADEVNQWIIRELNAHGDEGSAFCCMKVTYYTLVAY